jgi:hypothetical protein
MRGCYCRTSLCQEKAEAQVRCIRELLIHQIIKITAHHSVACTLLHASSYVAALGAAFKLSSRGRNHNHAQLVRDLSFLPQNTGFDRNKKFVVVFEDNVKPDNTMTWRRDCSVNEFPVYLHLKTVDTHRRWRRTSKPWASLWARTRTPAGRVLLGGGNLSSIHDL